MKNYFAFMCWVLLTVPAFNQSPLNWKIKASQQTVTLQEIEETFWDEFESIPEDRKPKELQSFNRFCYFWSNRVQNNIDFESDLSHYGNALNSFIELEQYQCDPGEGDWRLVGPGSLPELELGRVTVIWADPMNPEVLICASDDGSGIWRSTNNGENWTCATDNLRLPGLGISDIIHKPENSNILFASTGNTNLLRNPYSPGIIFSWDNGVTWSLLNSFQNNPFELINDFAFSTESNDVLYAIGDHHLFRYDLAADQDPINAPNPGAWTIMNISVDGSSFTDIPNMLFTDVEVLLNGNSDVLFISSKTSGPIELENSAVLLKSTNNGISWTNETGLIPSQFLSRISDPGFDIIDQQGDLVEWNDNRWDPYIIDDNYVAGCYEPESPYLFNTGNRLKANLQAMNIAPETDYEICFDYGNPENAAIRLILVWNYSGDSWDYKYDIFHSGFEESIVTNHCIILSNYYHEAKQNYVDYFLSQGETIEDIENILDASAVDFELIFTTDVISNFVYTEDSDLSDLPWVDNVSYVKLSPTYSGRIQLSQSDNQNLYMYQYYENDDFLGQTIDAYSSISNGYNHIYRLLNSHADFGGNFYNSVFESSPQEPPTLFFGGVKLCKYDVGQDLFDDLLGDYILHNDHRDICFRETSGGIQVFDGTDGGPGRSDDMGENWTSILGEGLAIAQYFGFEVSDNTNLCVAGTQDNDTHVFTDGQFFAITGTFLRDGGRVVLSDAFAQDRVGYTWNNQDFSKLTINLDNNGEFVNVNESLLSVPFFTSTSWNLDEEIVRHPQTGDIYIAQDHLYKFDPDQQGNDFIQILIPGADEVYDGNRPYRQNLNSIAFSNSDPDIIYVADAIPCWTNDVAPVKLKFFKSEDGGSNWVDLTSPEIDNLVPGENLLRQAYIGYGVRDILVSPENPNIVWICFPGVSSVDAQGNSSFRVLKSIDGGISWTDISEGLPPIPMHSMEFQSNSANRVYIGTDVGVYYIDDDLTEWQCFSSGLPACVVTDITINECRNKIYCCTFGRGIWEGNLPILDEVHIDENTVWSSDVHLEQGLWIETGSSLTIQNATVYMSGNTRIFVDLDAQLILNGAEIRPEECGAIWKGIELGGLDDDYQTPENQGQLTSLNNSIIEGAEIGVSNINSLTGDASGGIADMTNTSFNDCRVGVKLTSYPKPGVYEDFASMPANASNFEKCNFIWSDNVYDDEFMNTSKTEISPVGIHLTLVKGISINGCSFSNNAPTQLTEHAKNRGTGIYSNTASFLCHALEVDNGNGGLTVTRNEFSDLTNGVYSITCDPVYISSVDRTDFDQCWHGVVLEGQFAPRVTRSDFDVPYGWEYNPTIVPFGIYLDECSFYEIEENYIHSNVVNSLVYQAGIVVKNSYANALGENNDFHIYHNQLENIKLGISAEGNNANELGFNGLQIKCNNFNQSNGLDDEINIALSKPGTQIAPFQGSPSDETSPAGNVFTPAVSERNYFIQANALPLAAYWHHSPVVNIKLVPFPVSSGVNPLNSFQIFSTESSCETDLSELIVNVNNHYEDYESAIDEYNTVKDVYDGIVDSGNPLELIAYINDPTHESIAVRNEMLSKLPNSDAALRYAMIRQPSLNPWHMAQVLIANSPLKPAVIQIMNASGLDEFYRDLVYGAQNGGVTYKSILEADMSHFTLNASAAKSDYIREYLIGTPGINTQALGSIFTTPDNNLILRLNHSLRIHSGDAEEVLGLLGNCSISGGQDSYCEVQTILAEKALLEKLPNVLNAEEIEFLSSISEMETFGFSAAKALMELTTGKSHEQHVTWPMESRSVSGSSTTNTIQDLLIVYPNPTSAFTNISFKTVDGVENIRIEIFNSSGALVQMKKLNNSDGVVEVSMDLTEHPSGVYSIILYWDDLKVCSANLILNK